MLIISQVGSRDTLCVVEAGKSNLHLSLKMRFVDYWNRHRTIGILKCGHFEVLSWTGGVDSNGAWTGEAEVACKSPEAARYFKGVSSKANEYGIAAGSVAWVILSAPPVKVAGSVAVDKGLVPGKCC